MKILICHRSALAPLADGGVKLERDVCAPRGGGLGVYLVETINGLRARGVDIAGVEFDPDAAEDQQLADHFYRVRGFRFRFRPATIDSFRRILQAEAPDIVHLHALFYEMHPCMMDLLRPYRMVCTLHDVGPICFRGTRLNRSRRVCHKRAGVGCIACGCFIPGRTESIKGDLLRVLRQRRYLNEFHRADRVVVPSGYMRQALVENGFGDDRIEVIPLFTRFEVADGSDEDSKEVLFVGRLEPDKGAEQFVEALATIRDEPWTATVVGDGSTRAAVEKLASRIGVGDRIRFAGSASSQDLGGYYRRCSLVVFSSILPESFGLVGVEAMSFGKPVVAFPSGGVTQWLDDGVTGLIVPHGDVTRLAENIRRLLRDRVERQRLGDNARAAVQKKYTLARHLEQVQNLYHRVVQR